MSLRTEKNLMVLLSQTQRTLRDSVCVVSEEVLTKWGLAGSKQLRPHKANRPRPPERTQTRELPQRCHDVRVVPATVTLAVALTVLAPAVCLLEARQVYRAGLFTVTLRTDRTTSPANVSSTDASEIWRRTIRHHVASWDENQVLSTWGQQNRKLLAASILEDLA